MHTTATSELSKMICFVPCSVRSVSYLYFIHALKLKICSLLKKGKKIEINLIQREHKVTKVNYGYNHVAFFLLFLNVKNKVNYQFLIEVLFFFRNVLKMADKKRELFGHVILRIIIGYLTSCAVISTYICFPETFKGLLSIFNLI